MKRLSFKLIGILAAVLTTSVWSSYGQEAEEYKVYGTVLRHMFRDGTTQFDMNAKVDQIIIRSKTHSNNAYSPEKENWEQVKIRLRSLSDETIVGYESARKNEADFKLKLDIPYKYSLVDDERLAEIFGRDLLSTGSMDQWNEFYKLYPKSAGVNSFSSVDFDSKRSALVYFVNWCGPLCGTGTYVHVENVDKVWVVKGSGMMWISWQSPITHELSVGSC